MNIGSLHKDKMQGQGRIDLSDIDVFQRQYNENYRSLKYFGLHYLPDEETVSDLIQDLWLKLWERQGQYANEAAFKHYLFQALYNAILNHLKHCRVVSEYSESVARLDEEVELEISHRMIEAELYQAVNRVFDELSDSCRRVYAASLEGKSQKEIAEEFRISINTVKKHINNANHYMKERLKRLLLFFLTFR